MVEYTIARRYIISLTSLFEKEEYHNAYEMLLILSKGIEDSNSFKDFFENPLVDYEDKRKVLEASLDTIDLGKDKTTYEKVKKFLLFLLQEERLAILKNLITLFKDKVDEALNIVTLEIKTSHNVDKFILERIKNIFEKKLSKEIRINHNIDEEIIGGITIQYGDIIYDGSLKNQLKKLFKEFVI